MASALIMEITTQLCAAGIEVIAMNLIRSIQIARLSLHHILVVAVVSMMNITIQLSVAGTEGTVLSLIRRTLIAKLTFHHRLEMGCNNYGNYNAAVAGPGG